MFQTRHLWKTIREKQKHNARMLGFRFNIIVSSWSNDFYSILIDSNWIYATWCNTQHKLAQFGGNRTHIVNRTNKITDSWSLILCNCIHSTRVQWSHWAFIWCVHRSYIQIYRHHDLERAKESCCATEDLIQTEEIDMVSSFRYTELLSQFDTFDQQWDIHRHVQETVCSRFFTLNCHKVFCMGFFKYCD